MMRLSKNIIHPRYDLWKRSAPLKRNTEMIDLTDIVLIIRDGTSKGTQYTLNYAKNRNIPMGLIHVDDHGVIDDQTEH